MVTVVPRKGVCFNTGRTHFLKGHTTWNKGLTKETNKVVARTGRINQKKLKGRPMPKPEGFSATMRRAKPPRLMKSTVEGYVWLYLPDYPGSSKKRPDFGRIYEHRYVMERFLGRLLTKIEQIHHLDGIKWHNQVENLLLCANIKAHTKVHQLEARFTEWLIREGIAYYDRETGDFKLRGSSVDSGFRDGAGI